MDDIIVVAAWCGIVLATVVGAAVLGCADSRSGSYRTPRSRR